MKSKIKERNENLALLEQVDQALTEIDEGENLNMKEKSDFVIIPKEEKMKIGDRKLFREQQKSVLEIHESLDNLYNEMKRPEYSDQLEVENKEKNPKFDYFITDRPKKFDFL